MLATLRAIAEAVSQQSNLEEALACFVSMVKKAMRTECCSVYFADYHQDNFVLMASDGLNPEVVGDFRIGLTEGLVGLVAQREEPINIAHAQSHPKFKLAPEVHEEGYNAFLSVPVIHQKKVLGVIVVQQKRARVFSHDEESFLITLSAQLASQLANAEVKSILAQEAHLHQMAILKGVPSAPGIAIGEAFVELEDVCFSNIELTKLENYEEQKTLFYASVLQAKIEYISLAKKLEGKVPEEALAIFDIYQQLLDAKTLGSQVDAQLKLGWCAKSALKIVIEQIMHQFNSMSDPYIKERAHDVKEVGLRVLQCLLTDEQENRTYPDNTILITHTLTPLMLANIPEGMLKGVISVKGSANSHASIFIRAMGIPAIWGIEDVPLLPLENKQMILDAYAGKLFISPSVALTREYESLKHKEGLLHDKFDAEHALPATTLDGVKISLLLNAGLDLTSEHTNATHLDGVGLYRTESWFMQKGQFPSESEQEAWYRDILNCYHPAPVIMRTLDIGGDKVLDYFDIAEDNPFLGWRGIRVSLDHPELFLTQLKAMIKANVGLSNLKIMLPMVGHSEEIEAALSFIDQACFELQNEWADQFYPIERPQIGVMIEVPSSIYLLKEWSNLVDFCSVGSNDLTQYLLAVDRTNSQVANLFEPYHPSVLRALNHIAEQCQQNELPFSLCGELGSEPEGAILLIAMGFRQLSMNASAINQIKWVLRRVALDDTQSLLSECLAQSSSKQVHRLLKDFLIKHGLADLLYSGSSIKDE